MRTIEEVIDEIEDIEIDDINVGRATAVAERLDELLEIYKSERPTAYWFVDERPESNRETICSKCEQPVFRYHKLDFDYRPKYCPNCGVYMKGGETEMDDLISRQAVLDELRKAEDHAFNTYYKGLVKAHKIIADLPSAEKTGHWIVNEWGNIFCSECGCAALYDKVYPDESVFGKAIRVKSTFCPTCGAKMQEVKK